jgi:dihydrofolate reductase
MAKLVYSAITSLDGYIADKDGKFDWAVPDEEVLAFINDLERSLGTYLYGRRMYELMVVWETAPSCRPVRAPRRPRLQGRFGRRVPVVPHTHRGGRRQTSSPR